MKETGQLAYEAFRAVMITRGGAWKDWVNLDLLEQDAWRAAAHEAIQLGRKKGKLVTIAWKCCITVVNSTGKRPKCPCGKKMKKSRVIGKG